MPAEVITAMRESLSQLRFDNRFVAELPGDQEPRNYRRTVTGAAYSRVMPTPVSQPRLIGYATAVGQLLGLRGDPFSEPLFASVFGGNEILPGMQPYAMCYGGHQFGNWAGQLGDGRAINLGEVVNAEGERWVLQLKGAGPTPYSRMADGLAVLRSSIREFLCSEAMHHLGVPTTRALSLVLTGEQVVRDMFYDGRPEYEPGAVVCRVAPSFTRFGNFEIFSARRDVENLRRLVDYTLRIDYPQFVAERSGDYTNAIYATWFQEVCRRTAVLMVHWMRVGFVHGVMNTDNMSILGQTIDYGPYGWLEDYDPEWTPNTTDAQGRRYCFGQQPQIALWNLAQLANALLPLFDGPEPLQAGLDLYVRHFADLWREMMAGKLGLDKIEGPDDEGLVEEIWNVLQLTETDYTIFFRQLASLPLGLGETTFDPVINNPREWMAPLTNAWYDSEGQPAVVQEKTIAWLQKYQHRLQAAGIHDSARRQRMNQTNPKYVLRNYQAQVAIDQATAGDYTEIERLLNLLSRPYDEQTEYESYFAKRPEWARHRAGCSMLSCSS